MLTLKFICYSWFEWFPQRCWCRGFSKWCQGKKSEKSGHSFRGKSLLFSWVSSAFPESSLESLGLITTGRNPLYGLDAYIPSSLLKFPVLHNVRTGTHYLSSWKVMAPEWSKELLFVGKRNSVLTFAWIFTFYSILTERNFKRRQTVK